MILYAEVLIDVANRRLDRSYTYKIPEDLDVRQGMLVLVPLQNRKVQGLIIKITEELPEELACKEIRCIEGILEGKSLIPDDLIELAWWMAETTISPIAQSIHAVWPFLKGKVESWIIPLAKMEDADVQVLKLLDPLTYKVLQVLNRARRGGLPENLLLKRAEVKGEFLNELIKQGWIRKETRFTGVKSKEIAAGNCEEQSNISKELNNRFLTLTSQQKEVADKLWDNYLKDGERTILLHGVTGSGKTEVYLEMAERVLNKGGDLIILVPEISLTSQISRIFIKQFGEKVAVIHSGLKKSEKIKKWEQILRGEIRIAIGARSAVFAPLPNLKMIIIDEEHDGAYKQNENPKYHARDVARKRMEQKDGLVLLGSATPSLEAYAAAQRGIIGLLSLTERYNKKPLPRVELVDMKDELAKGNKSIFSFTLLHKLRERIERGEQAILFLNRRGYSTFVICRECGYVVSCPHCDVSLTYHSPQQELCCHYCNYRMKVTNRCPECGSRYIRFFGQGTQRVEEEISLHLPDVKVLRMDTDTMTDSQKHRAVLNKFRLGEASILVGTQMLAKGLDFPNVTLVGVIAADQLLNMPDFRSREKTFQLLTQVAGRAGRSSKEGEVVIQTYTPDDRAIIQASTHNYAEFFWEEIAYRKQLNYPPFSHIIRIMVYHSKEEKAAKASFELSASIRKAQNDLGAEDYQILGPAPSVLSKLKNQYRWQISIKGKKPQILREFVYKGVQAFYQSSQSSGVSISIEVNPLTS